MIQRWKPEDSERYRAMCPPGIDFKRADMVRRWFSTCLIHIKGELGNKPFHLDDWQFRDIIAPLFGRLDDDGLRITRTMFCLLPRKNGKSTICAGLALYMLFCDDEPGAEIYSCASTRDQAKIVFEMAAGMVRASPILQGKAKIYKNEIVHKNGGKYVAVSAEAGGRHGASASGIIFDEVHAFGRDRELWDVMTTSTAARRSPLTCAITTQTADRLSLCYELYGYSKQVRDGLVIDPSWLPVLYEAPKEMAWDSPETWQLANPGYGTSVKVDYLTKEVELAKKMPAREQTFRQLHLCQLTESNERWLSMEAFDRCQSEAPPDLTGARCYAGLDMSSNQDLTALVLVFPLDDGRRWVETHVWVPREGLRMRERRNLPTYDAWARKGWITVLDGEVIDYSKVRAKIFELAERYDIRRLVIDRWNSAQMSQELIEAGIKVEGMGQGFASMGPATSALERAFLQGKVAHDGNPVLRFCFSNATPESDSAGNIKLSKKKSLDRIDAAVAMCMANARLEYDEATGPSDGGIEVL